MKIFKKLFASKYQKYSFDRIMMNNFMAVPPTNIYGKGSAYVYGDNGKIIASVKEFDFDINGNVTLIHIMGNVTTTKWTEDSLCIWQNTEKTGIMIQNCFGKNLRIKIELKYHN